MCQSLKPGLCVSAASPQVEMMSLFFLRLLTLIILLAKLFFPLDMCNVDRVLTQFEQTLRDY